jgi:hypothetical protein
VCDEMRQGGATSSTTTKKSTKSMISLFHIATYARPLWGGALVTILLTVTLVFRLMFWILLGQFGPIRWDVLNLISVHVETEKLRFNKKN